MHAIEGRFPHDIAYRIDVPPHWNGALLSDLDYVSFADQPKYVALRDRGYACAGTARDTTPELTYDPAEGDRARNYDPLGELSDLLAVLDIFALRVEQPADTYQYGYSGGGMNSFSMAELHPERFSAVIPTCATIGPVANINSQLDMLFALRALLAPESGLAVAGIADDVTAEIGAWEKVITAAQTSAVGRARLVLASVLGQQPQWSDPQAPRPAPDNVDAIAEAVYRTTLVTIGALPGAPGLRARRMVERAYGGVPNWNIGVDYHDLFSRASAPVRRLVSDLYEKAGIEIFGDLQTVNQAPRIAADRKAVEYGLRHGRIVSGNPQVPVFIMHTIGDPASNAAITAHYVTRARAKGKGALVRITFVEAGGHGTFTTAEVVTAVETAVARARRGYWGDTSARGLTRYAGTLQLGPSRFIEYEPEQAYRPIYATDSYPPR